MVFYHKAIFTTALLLRNDPEVEAGGVRRQQAEEDAARGVLLDGRGSPLAVLDLNKAGNSGDANCGGERRDGKDEDYKNSKTWKLHDGL